MCRINAISLLIAVSIFAVSCSATSAPGSIQGHIDLNLIEQLERTDSSGTIIKIEGRSETAATDASGDFVLKDIPSGTYIISISHENWDTKNVQISVKAGAAVILTEKLDYSFGIIKGYLEFPNYYDCDTAEIYIFPGTEGSNGDPLYAVKTFTFAKLKEGNYKIKVICKSVFISFIKTAIRNTLTEEHITDAGWYTDRDGDGLMDKEDFDFNSWRKIYTEDPELFITSPEITVVLPESVQTADITLTAGTLLVNGESAESPTSVASGDKIAVGLTSSDQYYIELATDLSVTYGGKYSVSGHFAVETVPPSVHQQWGTSENEAGNSIAIDSSGNVFVAGYTEGSLDGNTNAGGDCGTDSIPKPCSDIFLIKWNADGTKAWTKQWGTAGEDRGYSVAVDNSGNIFVTGYTYGALDGNIKEGGSDPCTESYCSDIFLTKWNPDGTKAWTKQWGIIGEDGGQSVAADRFGNIFVTGYVKVDDYNIFLTKWNADGTKAWTKQWGEPQNDFGQSVVVDSSGNIFVSGQSEFPDNLDQSIFLTKFKPDGTEVWTNNWGAVWNACGIKALSTDIGDGFHIDGNSLAVDSAGNILVTGKAYGSFDGSYRGGYDNIFLIKCNTNGGTEWLVQWGDSSDAGNSVAVDSSDNIFVTGYAVGSLEGNKYIGGDDMFLTKWSADGKNMWTKQWGTANQDAGQSVAIDSAGNIFVTGYTEGFFDGYSNTGGLDIFLTKIKPY